MKIKKSQWYYRCCVHDLYKADKDTDEDKYLDEDIKTLQIRIFDTKAEAIKELKKKGLYTI